MSNTITVNVELCKEDRQRLEEIQGLLGMLVGLVGDIARPASTPTAPQEAPKAEEVKSDHPVDSVGHYETPAPEEPVEAPAEEPKPTVTLDQIRKKVTQLRASSDPKKKEGAKDIVMAYASNISALPEDKWPEIWDKLTALEG